VRLAPGLYQFDDGEARIIVAEVEARGGSLYGLVECWWQGKPVHWGRYDLQGPRTPGSMTKGCLETAGKGPWRELCPQVVWDVVHDHLAGDPLRTACPQLRPEEDAWLIRGLWRTAGATSLVGFGESGKSFLAQAAALTVCSGRAGFLGLAAKQKGPVGYLDWEGDAGEFDHRFAQLLAGANIDDPGTLKHRRERLPLHRSVTALQRHIADEGIVALVIDSVGYGRGGETQGDMQASTMLFYQAIAQLGLPSLLIDHRAKHAGAGDRTPLGAVSNYNSLRLLWLVTPTETRAGVSLRLRCGKSNYGRKPSDLAWDLDFVGDAARFTPRNPQTVAAMEDMSLGERLFRLLLDAGLAGMGTADLVHESGSADGTVRKALARAKEEGRVLKRDGVWLAVPEDSQEVAPF
jgi:hypothetical protein